MSQRLRQPEILEMARQQGKVSVDALARHFDVTEQTIRRDLGELALLGHIERVHGGAVPSSGTSNIQYEERRQLNSDAKTNIARACAALIPDGASLFLNIGSTTEAIARALMAHKNLLIVTNNSNIPPILADNPSCEVILTGGHFRSSDGGLVGDLAARTIRMFKFDLAIIGCSAMDESGDILDYDLQEVTVSQTILDQSRKTILAADHSKLHRSAPVRIATLKSLDVLVTDAALPAFLAENCAGWNTQVIIAPSHTKTGPEGPA
ncbi:MAG: DeoR/GlpR family DNA-binding transcription regulator [Pelagimonas sp.]|jgi:DeoR family glycerol-3-phosphate regulon repressor|nr:DeoR/GlpR family DNA-binding transcription regulator [Pelagimonas sp.]